MKPYFKRIFGTGASDVAEPVLPVLKVEEQSALRAKMGLVAVEALKEYDEEEQRAAEEMDLPCGLPPAEVFSVGKVEGGAGPRPLDPRPSTLDSHCERVLEMERLRTRDALAAAELYHAERDAAEAALEEACGDLAAQVRAYTALQHAYDFLLECANRGEAAMKTKETSLDVLRVHAKWLEDQVAEEKERADGLLSDLARAEAREKRRKAVGSRLGAADHGRKAVGRKAS